MTGKSELLERMTKQTMLYKNLPERTFFFLIYFHDKQDQSETAHLQLN